MCKSIIAITNRGYPEARFRQKMGAYRFEERVQPVGGRYAKIRLGGRKSSASGNLASNYAILFASRRASGRVGEG